MIPTQNESNSVILSMRLRVAANISLWLLFLLCIAWELFLAPLRPGGSLLFLKALPLAFAFRGVAKGSIYTLQWAAMLVLLYLMEGVMRVMSDPPGLGIWLAWLEIVLSLVFFFSAIFYVRPAKQAAKLAKQNKAAADN
jgi:uncharacterized membrane protein